MYHAIPAVSDYYSSRATGSPTSALRVGFDDETVDRIATEARIVAQMSEAIAVKPFSGK